MGISSAIASATSGLFTTARSAQTVSDNIANALTPGYAPREVMLESGRFGGVKISAIARRETLSLITDRRMAEAERLAQATGLASRELRRWVGRSLLNCCHPGICV